MFGNIHAFCSALNFLSIIEWESPRSCACSQITNTDCLRMAMSKPVPKKIYKNDKCQSANKKCTKFMQLMSDITDDGVV